jgi:hypothetical protein
MPTADAAYVVKFYHFSASPNGMWIFPQNVRSGFINPQAVVERIRLLSSQLPGSGNRKDVNLRWQMPPSLRYIIESSDRLNGGSWSGVITGAGDGLFQEFIETNTLDRSRFYRLRIAE